MADDKAVGAPALDTNIESGNFDEKRAQPPVEGLPPKKDAPAEEEDEDADIDALIEDLESEDGHAFDEDDEEETVNPGTGRIVPEDMLQTDSRLGLTESEVVARRRKYGLNQMKEEKENLVLKFLGFFIGPIQFVMEVSFYFYFLVIFFSPAILFFDLHSINGLALTSVAMIRLVTVLSNTITPSSNLSASRVPPTRRAFPRLALGSRLAVPHELHTASALIGSNGLAELIYTCFPALEKIMHVGGGEECRSTQ